MKEPWQVSNTFFAAKLSDAVFAAKPGQHDPGVLLGRMPLAGRRPDVLPDLPGRGPRRHGVFGIPTSPRGQEEPQTLRNAITPNQPVGAEGGLDPKGGSEIGVPVYFSGVEQSPC